MSVSFNNSINFTIITENISALSAGTSSDIKAGLVVRLVVSLIGTIANSLLLIACYQQQQPRFTASGILILVLTINWLVQSAVYYPILNAAKIVTIADYNIGKGYCPIMLVAMGFFVIFGAVIESCLAWNRLVAVWLPTRYPTLCSHNMTLIMSLASAAIALAYALSITSYGITIVSVGDNATCVFVPGHARAAQLMAASVFGPIAVPGVFYGLLFGKVIQLKRRATAGAVGQVMQRRIQLSLALLGTFACAVVCMLPPMILMVYFPHSIRSKSVTFWITTLNHSQCSFCPMVMLWTSSDYWTTIKRIFGRKLPTGTAKTSRTSTGVVKS